MSQGLDDADETGYYGPAYQSALATRNYKHIDEHLHSRMTYELIEEDIWTYVIRPWTPEFSECGLLDKRRNDLIVAVDGACRGNGTVNARAAISVFFGLGNMHNFMGTLDFDPKPTSQKAELCAAIKAIEIFQRVRSEDPEVEEMGHLVIKSDSAYVVNSMTEFICKWRMNGFKTSKGRPVQNQDLMEYLDQLASDLRYTSGIPVLFWHVPREYNQDADYHVNVALNAPISPHKVYILAPLLDNNADLVEIYMPLIKLLEARAQVFCLHNTRNMHELVEGGNTRFLLMSDTVTEGRNHTDMVEFAAKVKEMGSRVVFGGLFAVTAQWPSISKLFNEIFALPWRMASYTKDPLTLHRKNPNCSTEGLIASEYVEAVFLKNVPTSDTVYATRYRSAEAYATCSRYGAGYVGYIGDVDCDALFVRAVVAMLGLPPVDEDQPFRLKTKATKIKEMYGPSIVDNHQIDF